MDMYLHREAFRSFQVHHLRSTNIGFLLGGKPFLHFANVRFPFFFSNSLFPQRLHRNDAHLVVLKLFHTLTHIISLRGGRS